MKSSKEMTGKEYDELLDNMSAYIRVNLPSDTRFILAVYIPDAKGNKHKSDVTIHTNMDDLRKSLDLLSATAQESIKKLDRHEGTHLRN